MTNHQPTTPFVFASWTALLSGTIGYLIGLWNADMLLSEKGYYFTILMFGLFGAVSVQKSVRDRMEDIPVTNLYYSISWFATLMAILLLVIGLWNADMLLSEKGFYGMAYLLSLFAAIVVQKNTRDGQVLAKQSGPITSLKQTWKGTDANARPATNSPASQQKIAENTEQASKNQSKITAKPQSV